jgi:two-component system, NarL family, sensor kinase
MATERLRTAVRVAAGAVAVLVTAAVLLAFLLWIAGGMRPMPVNFGRTMLGVVGLVLAPIAFAAVGGILASQVPRNPIGWIFLAVALSVGMMLPVNVLVASAHESLRQAPDLVIWAAWFRTALGSPVMLTLLIIAALIFPDGRALNPRWRPLVAVTAVGGLLLVGATSVDPRGLWSYPSLPNPLALPYRLEPVVTGVRLLAMAVLVPCIGFAVAAVWIRYQRGTSLVRAQLRWIFLAVLVSGLAVLPYLAARFVFVVDEATGERAAAVAQIGSTAFPIAAAFAISRYRLFDIDVLIGRTLVYLPLTAILGGMYTAGLALFQRLFVAVTGETSDLAIVLGLLLVATAFTPLRKGLEGFAERRFAAGGGSAAAAGAASGGGAPSGGTAAATGGSPISSAAEAPFASSALLDAGHGDTTAEVVPITPAGSVICPLGPAKTVYQCLTCPYFRATLRLPAPSIVCQPPPTSVSALR